MNDVELLEVELETRDCTIDEYIEEVLQNLEWSLLQINGWGQTYNGVDEYNEDVVFLLYWFEVCVNYKEDHADQ